MRFSTIAATVCLSIAGLLTSCAQGWTPQNVDEIAGQYAASSIEDWGLVKGSPREGKLRELAVRTLRDASFVAAAKTKPSAESWNEWEARLTNEGIQFLNGDEVLRFLGARARLFNEATDTECAAGVQLLAPNEISSPILAALAKPGSRAFDAQLKAVWRQRLARVSEEDFDALTQTPAKALLARTRRISEALQPIPPADHRRVTQSLNTQLMAAMSVDTQKGLIGAANSGDSESMCKLARVMLLAQSRLSSADASIGMRIFGEGEQ